MSAARRAAEPEQLTPQARVERAKRRLADDIDELVEAKMASRATAGEWVDQFDSPLGRRRHNRLARTGKIPATKDGQKWLVRRDDMNAYLEREGLHPVKHIEEESPRDVLDKIAKGGGRRR